MKMKTLALGLSMLALSATIQAQSSSPVTQKATDQTAPNLKAQISMLENALKKHQPGSETYKKIAMAIEKFQEIEKNNSTNAIRPPATQPKLNGISQEELAAKRVEMQKQAKEKNIANLKKMAEQKKNPSQTKPNQK